MPAASVKAVFNKLLDDRCRSLDHFTRGDPAHHLAGKHLYRG
jgi:hypothetical protein